MCEAHYSPRSCVLIGPTRNAKVLLMDHRSACQTTIPLNMTGCSGLVLHSRELTMLAELTGTSSQGALISHQSMPMQCASVTLHLGEWCHVWDPDGSACLQLPCASLSRTWHANGVPRGSEQMQFAHGTSQQSWPTRFWQTRGTTTRWCQPPPCGVSASLKKYQVGYASFTYCASDIQLRKPVTAKST